MEQAGDNVGTAPATVGRAFDAAIKPEYRISAFVPINAPPAAAVAAASAEAPGEGSVGGWEAGGEKAADNGGGGGGHGGGFKSRKRERGMNKKRPREKGGADGGNNEQEHNLCRPLLATGQCQFGDERCRFSHDLVGYLKRKEKDLGESCPLFEAYGHCPSGITCRFGKGHIDFEKGTNVVVVDSETGQPKPPPPPGLNVISQEAMSKLRKNAYPLKTPRADRKAQTVKFAPSAPPPTSTSTAGNGRAAVDGVGVGVFDPSPLPAREMRRIDFREKVYIAPLTTVGNLPFRRVMKDLGADITCGEMALAANILGGQKSELALLRRHPCEDVFGIQLAGAHPDMLSRCTELLVKEDVQVDFIDLNLGCPIDLINNQGMGASLMQRTNKLKGIVTGMTHVLKTTYPAPLRSLPGETAPDKQTSYRLASCPPITIKMRSGWDEKKPSAHLLVPQLQQWAATEGAYIGAVFIHGRSRQQRYTKLANWDYVRTVAQAQDPALPRLTVIGNGDVLSWTDHEAHKAKYAGALEPCAMVGRGALIKPWLPTEIKEQRHWDISASERLDILRDFVRYGLEHWGSDQRGVNTTRRFLLEWLSFTYRYVPVGLLEHAPMGINDRPMPFKGRSDLETLLASPFDRDWIKISEMLLGPVPDDFQFVPKHKANSYSTAAASASSAGDMGVSNG